MANTGIFAFLIICYATMQCSCQLFQYNMSEYWQMPPLYQYDNMDVCLRSKSSAAFCVVKTLVKPDNRSELWGIIQRYSKYAFQYNHALLTRGVCLEDCMALTNSMDTHQKELYYQRKFDINYKYIVDDRLLPNIDSYRQQFGDDINVCENYKLQTSYNLSAYSEIEYCYTNETLFRKIDFLDVLFYVVVIALVLLGIFSSYYDAKIAKTGDEYYFKRPLHDKKSNILTAFSIRRNVERLTMAPEDNHLQQDLGFLDALRTLTMTVVMVSHIFIGERMVAKSNPEAVEIADSSAAMEIIAAICPFTVNVFFAISGLLLAVFFVKLTLKKRFNLSYFWLGLVNRYLRTFPVYAVVMLFTVSVYDRLLWSPSGYNWMPLSRSLCRAKWWINFLFINNYYQPEEICLIHTWYLAADFQLFMVGLIALMVIWRFPRSLKWIVGALLGMGFIFPAVRVYMYSFNAMMLISNKGHARRLWYEDRYINFYQTTDAHCASYFSGLFVGLLYHKVRENSQILTNSKIFTVLRYASIPLLIAFFLPAPVFHHLNLPKPSLSMAIYAGLHRWVFGTGVAVVFLLYMFGDSDSILGALRSSKILQSTFIRVCGRLSFSFYLIHMSILEAIMANHHEAARVSAGMTLSIFCSATSLTAFVSFLAFIFIEKPCDVIFKQLLSGDSRDKTTQSANGTNGFTTIQINLNQPDLTRQTRL
ncbi:nose resistant to fluoxetine protein 6-like [Toxorhynchites rutilus septentrionalis]|uniref:nose resistant to fluoxetine protein 6-like n=1 Tax=Toxorhynchites rutilus septentrionalis TaxID=329112 RepID=UPI002479EEE9|nr:nose resistant to fluoxetine protein 6-like [Toxorhynchites rutilus septentrionalis]